MTETTSNDCAVKRDNVALLREPVVRKTVENHAVALDS